MANQYGVAASVYDLSNIDEVTGETVKTKVVVKGAKASHPYRVRLLPIQKQTIGSILKSGGSAFLKRSPYWIAAMIAMNYILDDDGNVYQPDPSGSAPDMDKSRSTVYLMNSGGSTNVTRDSVSINTALNIWNTQFGSALNNVKIVGAWSCSSSDCRANATWKSFGSSYSGYIKIPTDELLPPADIPIADEDFLDSVMPYIAANPTKEALRNPDAPNDWSHLIPTDDFTYLPDAVTQQDEDYINYMLDGIAQSTDPNAPGYIDPADYDRIADMASDIQGLDTPEGQADALNSEADAPLTAASMAEILEAERVAAAEAAATLAAEQAAADESAISAAEADANDPSNRQDDEDLDDEDLMDLINQSLDLPDLFDLPTISAASCQSMTLDFIGTSLSFPGAAG
ncbi:hypothetical protein GCM10022393_43460 [Aquimarina addita]